VWGSKTPYPASSMAFYGWAKIKLKSCGVQDLAFAIIVIESLIEFMKKIFKRTKQEDVR